MTARTWVGRVCLHGGQVAEEGPWLGSLVRQRPDGDGDDELYVVVEPATPGSTEYTSQLVDVIAQLYARDPLSLTGALTRSLREAHDHLREWNRKSLREHRVGAGASCLALRDTEAYLAQVGPSLAFVRSADGAFRRLQPDDTSIEGALGVQDGFAPTLMRIPLEPGDLVVLASSKLESIVPAATLELIMARGIDEVLPELYRLCRDEGDIALLALACFDEPEPEPADTPPPYLTRNGAREAHEDAAPRAAPLDDVMGLDAPVGVAVAEPPPTAEASMAVDAGFDLPRRPSLETVTEIAASTGPPPATNLRLKEDAGLRYKKTTGQLPVPAIRVPRLALFAAVAVALVVALLIWQFPRSVSESREETFATLIADAREANAVAQATDDPGLRRQLLSEASAKLDEAAKIHDDDGALIALRADVDAAIGVLNAEYEVREFTPIIDLAQQVGGSFSITQSAIGGGNAYLLDAEGRRVLRVSLTGGEAPATVVEEGELAGALTAARPALIAWSEQTQTLVVLDEQRQAIGYFPAQDGALPLAVREPEAWESADAIAASGGNLYVLDVAGNQVWRYLPGQGGFDSERTGLLDGADLANATEIAVGPDLYVLDSELGVRRFSGRTEAPFPLAGIDRPLMSPASLQVLPGSNRIVVADRANKRIVVASAEGEFLRQIVSPAFTDLRAVSVDEGSGTLYVLNGDVLMRAPFPP